VMKCHFELVHAVRAFNTRSSRQIDMFTRTNFNTYKFIADSTAEPSRTFGVYKFCVRLSVTDWFCVNTTEPIINQSRLDDCCVLTPKILLKFQWSHNQVRLK